MFNNPFSMCACFVFIRARVLGQFVPDKLVPTVKLIPEKFAPPKWFILTSSDYIKCFVTHKSMPHFSQLDRLWISYFMFFYRYDILCVLSAMVYSKFCLNLYFQCGTTSSIPEIYKQQTKTVFCRKSVYIIKKLYIFCGNILYSLTRN